MLFTLRGKSVDGLSDKTTYIILQYGMIVNFLSMVEFKSKTSKTMWQTSRTCGAIDDRSNP